MVIIMRRESDIGSTSLSRERNKIIPNENKRKKMWNFDEGTRRYIYISNPSAKYIKMSLFLSIFFLYNCIIQNTGLNILINFDTFFFAKKQDRKKIDKLFILALASSICAFYSLFLLFYFKSIIKYIFARWKKLYTHV